MTSRDIDRTLSLLLPTHSSSHPASLTSLATTLLAQSRAKAPNLKPEEEIARTYACCHIACARLRDRLGLELGKGGAPCGPKIYRKLYGFLETALGDVALTPGKRKVRDDDGGGVATPGSGKRMREAGTPTSTRGRVLKGTPKSIENGKGLLSRAGKGDGAADQLPAWTMSLCRRLCKDYATPKLATHIYAGVESVYNEELGSRKPGGKTMLDAEAVAALVCCIFAIASAKTGSSGETDDERRDELLATAEDHLAASDVTSNKGMRARMRKQYDKYASSMEHWQSMEWYQSLPSARDGEDDSKSTSSRTPRKQSAKTPLRRKEKHAQPRLEDGEDLGAAGLLPGLGTMFQPAVDWLSEERRRDYAVWKSDVLKEVALIESHG